MAAPAATRPAARVLQRALLGELEQLSQGRGLSYAERRHLGEDIDLVYLHGEIARHERHLHVARRYLMPLAGLYFAGLAAVAAHVLLSGEPAWERLLPMLALSFAALTVPLAVRHTRRRLGVLHRLRALATAAATPS
ncbi:MAG: hypothetical protein ACK41D_06470 [Rubricoccaceae bacterium]